MIEWNEMQLAMRDALRRFISAELAPRIEDIEHNGVPPYDILRKLFATFGIGAMALGRFQRQLEKEKKGATDGDTAAASSRKKDPAEVENTTAMSLISIIELCRYAPGLVTALGCSTGLAPNAIIAKGTTAQKERWVPALLTLEKIGAWAITEPGSGSDAFGAMKSTARRDGDGYVLNGSKTFITNGPFADTTIFICKLDEPGVEPKDRKVVSFVLDKGMPGFTQSKPLRKMGQHSSPTGELFLEDVRVGRDRLIGETEDQPARSGAKDTFTAERQGAVAIALGIVEECRKLSIAYARSRVRVRPSTRSSSTTTHPARSPTRWSDPSSPRPAPGWA